MSSAVNPPDDRTARGPGAGDNRDTVPTGRPVPAPPPVAARTASDRRTVVARQKEAFGGMKMGSAFFGWLAATGTVVVLTALLTAIVSAAGATGTVDPATPTTGTLQAYGVAGGIVILAILFIGYFCGGYVAGRMARFNGLKQGLGVWLWALVVAVVVAVVAAVADTQFDLLEQANLSLPVDPAALTTLGVVSVLIALAVTLVGAMLGGLAGMRFHRRVDRAGFGE